MQGRTFNSGNYRYGFNGQEKDDEVVGNGNMLAFEFREYDSRLARFFAVDPLTKKYPELTPYQFANNTPIWAKELEGLEANYSNGQAEEPFGGSIETGGKTGHSGPLSDSYAKELNVVPGDTPGSQLGLKSSVDIISGSKPVPNLNTGEEKIAGGLAGGHATINLGDKVYSFSNDVGKAGNHLFAKSGDDANSEFHNYKPADFERLIKDKQVVSFELDLTLDQRQAIKNTYQGKPTFDYSLFGYRCASMTLRTLSNIGVTENSNFSSKYIHGVTPGALIRHLENKGFTPNVKPGTPFRIFNNNFQVNK